MTDLLLTLHLLAVVLWVGGGVTMHIFGVKARKSGDPERRAQFVRDSNWIGTRIYAPLSLILLLAGGALVADLELSFGEPWIIIGLLGWLASFVIGVAYYGRKGEEYERLIESEGVESSGALANYQQVAMVNRVEISILLIVVIDMVVKPGGP